MRKRTKINIDPKYILVIIVVACVVLMLVSFKFQEKMTPVRSAIGNVITPMQNGINKVGAKIAEQIEYINTVKNLVDENKELKKQIEQLSSENKLLQHDKYELENFRKLYDLDGQYESYPKVTARVVSSGNDNWYNTFIIDKGSDDGLAVNMNVMAGDGLVGIITDVNKSYSRVRSIIDDASNVAGTFLKTSDGCIVSGNLSLMNEGVIEITDIKGTANVKDGYAVVTSQISDKYLPGILIGYVKDIKRDSSNITQTGRLMPAADFSKLNMVLVITQVKDSEDLEEMLSK
jgi:rod shape-determining protein MreC